MTDTIPPRADTHADALALSNRLLAARARQLVMNKHISDFRNALGDARSALDGLTVVAMDTEDQQAIWDMRQVVLRLDVQATALRRPVHDDASFGL